MTDSIDARVARGVRFLDETEPGWHRLINLETLNLADRTTCVCGQVYEERAKALGFEYGYAYAEGVVETYAYGWMSGSLERGEHVMEEHGFLARLTGDQSAFTAESKKLTKAWQVVIFNRTSQEKADEIRWVSQLNREINASLSWLDAMNTHGETWT